MYPTKHAIEDAMTIRKWVADNTVADYEDIDDDEDFVDGGQPPSNGDSSNSNA